PTAALVSARKLSRLAWLGLLRADARKAQAGGLIPPASTLRSWWKWQTQRSQKPSSQGMGVQVSPSAPISSLRQAAKASGLHPDIRRFESVREHQSKERTR